MPYVTVVPAIRTIPGVERFDYALDGGSSLAAGDLIRVPFRRRSVPALVVSASPHSQFADKAIKLKEPVRILAFGGHLPRLLEAAASRTFVSQPSMLHAWLRQVPKRAVEPDYALPPVGQISLAFNTREFRPLADLRRGHDGLLKAAKNPGGRTLVLSPWMVPAAGLAAELNCPILHSGLNAGQAWKLVAGFVAGSVPRLVATKVGAWLACFADRVLIEEPENDDHKQDELSPRFDARWVVAECQRLRRGLGVFEFSLTPRLSSGQIVLGAGLRIEPEFENLSRQGRTDIEPLMSATLMKIEEAVGADRPLAIIHPPRGERSRYACSNCGWQAVCGTCGYALSQYRTHGLCRKCGRRNPLPGACPRCSGTDFSRGAVGQEKLRDQLSRLSLGRTTKVLNLTQTWETDFPESSVVVVTNAALLAGTVEDIRRRERLVQAWRRLAAKAQAAKARLIVQAQEEVLPVLRDTLTAEGLAKEQRRELEEREVFGFPPACAMVKLVFDGPEADAASLLAELSASLPQGWSCDGPFPVAYRPAARGQRFVVLARAPRSFDPDRLIPIFNAFKGRAHIDLDPVAFFC